MKANFLALLLGCFIAILCAEVVLRLLPPPFMADQLYHDYDPDVGWLLRPIKGGQTSSACVNINGIHVNSLGFRDKEWRSKPKIAVLGDSFMQGAQLPEGTPLPQVLESLLGVSVFNAGIDGFGTLHEYLVYKKYVAQFRPDIVLLLFYPVNDVADSSARFLGSTTSPMPRAMLKDGKITVSYPSVTMESHGIRTMMKEVKTALLFRRAYDYVMAMYLDGRNVDMGGGVYLPENETWQEAWHITEHYLSTLNDEVTSYGGKLYLIVVPEYIQLAHEWEKALKAYYLISALPEGFSRERPVRKLEAISKAHHVPMIHLDHTFREYRDRFRIPAPYFYYRCDGHWNPLGHFLGANVIAKELIARGMVTGDMNRINQNLQIGPVQILSDNGYRQIYAGGRFTGKTNIPKLLAGSP